jgi:hypothetical protein
VPPRRGVAAILAMIYLCLFATLAIGFYSTITTAVQISKNEKQTGQALMAADSGLQFIRYHLANAQLTGGSSPSALFTALAASLQDRLDGSANMAGHDPTTDTADDGSQLLFIPGASGSGASRTCHWMNLGPDAGSARVVLQLVNSKLQVKVVGMSAGATPSYRAIQYDLKPVQTAWVSPSAGILTRSPVELSNGAEIDGGDVLSATAQAVASLTMSGGAKIRQNFYYTANAIPPSIENGARVDGEIAGGIAPPSFPTVDTTPFAAFVPDALAPVGPRVLDASSSLPATATFTNIRIKANANINFGNAMTLNGVIYIESPNKISFGGGSRINGIIVTDNNPAIPMTTGGVIQNQITLNNGVRVDGLETLDPDDFDPSDNIAALKQLAGAIVLAPYYKLVLAGGARSYNDSLVASNFDISNGYRGTIAGNLINLDDTAFTMKGGGQLTFSGVPPTVGGLYGGTSFALDFGSYAEVPP